MHLRSIATYLVQLFLATCYLKLSLKRIYVITHGIQQETAVKLKNVMSNTW